MRILVDADACPVKQQIVRLARKNGCDVIMLADTSHRLEDGYSTVIVVDKGADSADIRLANLVRADDIVVTQDYGVAAMALGKGARALNQNGMEYCDGNMDQLLFERHLGRKVRRAGQKTAHIPKRTAADDLAFLAALERMLMINETPGTPQE